MSSIVIKNSFKMLSPFIDALVNKNVRDSLFPDRLPTVTCEPDRMRPDSVHSDFGAIWIIYLLTYLLPLSPQSKFQLVNILKLALQVNFLPAR